MVLFMKLSISDNPLVLKIQLLLISFVFSTNLYMDSNKLFIFGFIVLPLLFKLLVLPFLNMIPLSLFSNQTSTLLIFSFILMILFLPLLLIPSCIK
jgi:hypothetical protein